jgi:hypothetical protein
VGLNQDTRTSPRDYDSPWKEAVDHPLPALVALLPPEVHGEIGWSHDSERLEQDLRKLAPEGGAGKRLADTLVQARAKLDFISRLHGRKPDAGEMRPWNRDRSSACSPAEVEDQSISPRQRASARHAAR